MGFASGEGTLKVEVTIRGKAWREEFVTHPQLIKGIRRYIEDAEPEEDAGCWTKCGTFCRIRFR